jgi:hypothetical protein
MSRVFSEIYSMALQRANAYRLRNSIPVCTKLSPAGLSVLASSDFKHEASLRIISNSFLLERIIGLLQNVFTKPIAYDHTDDDVSSKIHEMEYCDPSDAPCRNFSRCQM